MRPIEDLVDEIVGPECDRWGAPDVRDLILPSASRDGDCLVLHRRTDDPDSGVPIASRLPLEDGRFTDGARTILLRYARRMIRARLRRKAIGPRDGQDPLWSYTIHRLARRVLMQRGVSPSLMQVRATTDDQSIRAGLGYLIEQHGLTMGDVTLGGGRIDVSLISGTMGDQAFSLIGNGRPAILLPDVRLPETLLSTLPGAKLSRILGHEDVAKAGPIRIEDVHQNDGPTGSLTLALEDVQDPLARPPRGADRTWMKVPWDPFFTKT